MQNQRNTYSRNQIFALITGIILILLLSISFLYFVKPHSDTGFYTVFISEDNENKIASSKNNYPVFSSYNSESEVSELEETVVYSNDNSISFQGFGEINISSIGKNKFNLSSGVIRMKVADLQNILIYSEKLQIENPDEVGYVIVKLEESGFDIYFEAVAFKNDQVLKYGAQEIEVKANTNSLRFRDNILSKAIITRNEVDPLFFNLNK